MFELQVDEVGPALRYATAKVNKANRSSGVRVPTDDGLGNTPVLAGIRAGAGDEPSF